MNTSKVTISLFTDNSILKISFDEDDFLEVNRNFEWSPLHWSAVLLTCVLILVVNMRVLLFTNIKESKLVDMMVLVDCLANLSIIGVLFLAFPVRIFQDTRLCYLIETYRGLSLVINRLALTKLERILAMQCSLSMTLGSFQSLSWSTES